MSGTNLTAEERAQGQLLTDTVKTPTRVAHSATFESRRGCSQIILRYEGFLTNHNFAPAIENSFSNIINPKPN